jgi:hypothetical protein
MTAGAAPAVRVWDGSNSVTNCCAGVAVADADAELPLAAERGGLGGLGLGAMEKDSFFSSMAAAAICLGKSVWNLQKQKKKKKGERTKEASSCGYRGLTRCLIGGGFGVSSDLG